MADVKKNSVALAAFSPFLIVIAALLIAAAAYYLLFYPKLRLLVKGGELDLDRVQSLIDEETQRKALVDNLEATYKGLNPARREKIQQIVPLEPDVPGLFVELDAIARQNNFTLTSIDTTQDDKQILSGGRKPTKIAANFTGGEFAYFAQLLRDVERLRRITDVESVVFTPNTGTYSFVMNAYNLDKDFAAKGAVPSATVGPAAAAAKVEKAAKSPKPAAAKK